MTNLDYWNTFVGEESPETFMRNHGSSDPELCVARFLEERGQLYGVVNQGSWVKTFSMPEQHHCLSVKIYLLSYLDETSDDWRPALEANPPHTPRRYREKFDPDRYPPPGATENDTAAEEVGTYGTYFPDSDHDFSDDARLAIEAEHEAAIEEDLARLEANGEMEPSVVMPSFSDLEEKITPDLNDPRIADVFVPESQSIPAGATPTDPADTH